ncbi:MAG TPA: glycosyltransferase family 4 protein [Clostridiales bacterium]|nr:glycosyltransferase family 4 protein [Clostridiales bacterium]
MNILYISSKKRWGGVVSWMVKTSSGLSARGHKVTILSHPRSKLNKSFNENIKLIPKKLGSTFNPVSIVYIARLIKRENIDIVVTNIDKEIGIGGIAAKLCGTPNIRRVGREDDFNSRLRTKLTHKFLVTKCIVPCKYVIGASLKRAKWLKDEEFTVIHNGRNPYQADPDAAATLRSEWNVLPGEKIIGMTCQLTKVKYTQDMIKAFSRISENHPEWKLVITGEGPERNGLEELTEKLGLKERTVFAGFTDDPLLTASCYDIAMSTSKIEGFPNTIVEYFAAGKPVISTDAGGVREIIEDGINGMVVPFGDSGALTEALEKLVSDDDLRNKFGKKALETLKLSFTEDMMIDKLEKFFSDCVR